MISYTTFLIIMNRVLQTFPYNCMFQKLIYSSQFVRSLGNRNFHVVFVKVKFIIRILFTFGIVL